MPKELNKIFFEVRTKICRECSNEFTFTATHGNGQRLYCLDCRPIRNKDPSRLNLACLDCCDPITRSKGRRLRCEACSALHRAKEGVSRRKAKRSIQTEANQRLKLVERPWLDPSLSPAERKKARGRMSPLRKLQKRAWEKIRGGRFDQYVRKSALGFFKGKALKDRLGYSPEELRRHLERQFVDGMDWAAFSDGRIHIDHILPLRMFDLSKSSEVRAAWALSNLQPLWAEANLKKNGKRIYLL